MFDLLWRRRWWPLLRLLTGGLTPRCRSHREARAPRRLYLERLEDRTVLSVVNWTNPSGGDWDTPGNWSTGNVPAAGDDVLINTVLAPGAAITHNQGVADSVHGLTLSDPVNFSGGNLTIANNSTINSAGSFSATGGTNITTSAPVNNSGNVTIGNNSTLSVGGSGTPTLPTNGLVSLWSGEGNANDSVGGNNGTLLPGTTFASGKVGQAFQFDGVSGAVDVGNAPNLQVSSGDFTVEAWVYFNSLVDTGNTGLQDMSLVDKMSASGINTDGWRLIKQDDKHFWFGLGGGNTNGLTGSAPTTVISTTTVTAGTWYQVAAVKSSTEIDLFVNGVEEASKPTPAFTDTNSTDLLLGEDALQGAYLNGLLDEVAIYNRALSPAEIEATYIGGSYIQSGGSTLLSGGSLVAAGVVNIDGGTLAGAGTITGNVVNSSEVSPGTSASPGTLNMSGSYSQTAYGILQMKLGGPNAGTGYDQITVGTSITLAGTLQLDLVNGFTPYVNEQFTIISNQNNNPIVGQFTNLPESGTLSSGGNQFEISYMGGGGNDVVLTALTANLPVPATHFAISAPSSAMAGAPLTITVTALTASNATALGYAGTIHFTKTDTGASSFLPSDYTFTTAVNGSHVFTNAASLVTAGTQTIMATDTASSIIGSTNVTVAPLTSTHLQVTAPVVAAPGFPFRFTVTAEDQYNNPATSGYAGTIHFVSSDGSATLPTNTALTNGTGTFSATVNALGNQTISASDTVSLITGTSNLIAVSPTATQLAVSAPNGATAGGVFLVTVTAQDGSGHTAIAYTGIVHITSSGGAPILPADATLTNGVGSFLVTLTTAGTFTVKGQDTLNATVAGSSGNIVVSPGAASYFTITAPTAATTGSAFNVTVKAFDQFGNIATAYTGTVSITSTDPAAAILVPSYTFVAADNGVHTFNNVKLNSSTLASGIGTTIIVRDTSATAPPIVGLSAPVSVQGLVVPTGGFKSTATGFIVTFSKPIMPADLTMYGLNNTTVQDVTMVGADIGSGPFSVPGTLFLDPTTPNTLVFKATSAYSLAANQGVGGTGDNSVALPDDTYTVTLVSGTGSNGFVDALGNHLDGLGNGGAANYSQTFATTFQDDANANAHPIPVLSIPDFARGPDGSTTITVPNNKTVPGIPITLYNAAGVQDATFTLTFNPQIFTPTGGGTGDSPTGSTFTMGTIASIDSTHSSVPFIYHNATAHSGTVVLGDILATVPNSAAAIYKTKELLTLSGITVTGGATVQAADGIHVDAYLGDVHVTALPAIDASDALDAQKVASGAATGFTAYTLLDPAIIGNVGQNISVDAAAVTNLFSKAAHLAVPRIPSIPAAVTAVSVSGADPTLSLVGTAQANGIVSVQVMLDHPHPAGSTGMTEAHLALTYDPSVLSVSASDITLGSIPGADWWITSEVDAATGQIGINLLSLEGTPITATEAGSLVNIAFHVLAGAAGTGTSVQLVNQVTANGERFVTEVDDDQGPLTLSPGVDRVDVAVGWKRRARVR